MTGIVEVDTEALNRLAEQIRQAAAQAHLMAADPHGSLRGCILALGAPSLVTAAGTFVSSWTAALADVVAEANRLADSIALVSNGYRDAESTVLGLLP